MTDTNAARSEKSANVTTMRRQTPTEQSASRDAIGAIIDSIMAAHMRETNAARKKLEDADAAMLKSSAEAKHLLERLVTTVESINGHTVDYGQSLERTIGNLAQSVNP